MSSAELAGPRRPPLVPPHVHPRSALVYFFQPLHFIVPLLAYGLSEIGCGITRMPPFLSVVVMGLAVDSLVGNRAAHMQREWTMPKAVFACPSESDTSLFFLQFF